MLSLFQHFIPQKRRVEMGFAGDPQVIKNILKKKELLGKKDPNHKKIKTALLMPGGGQRGIIEGGAMIALQKLELQNAFDYVIGISAGAAAGYYLLAEEPAIGTSVYFDDNVENHFVNFLRPWKLMDIKSVEQVLRTVKPANLENLAKSRSTFLIGMTDAKTGEQVFIEPKELEDPISGLMASVSVPLATGITGGNRVVLEGKEYVDGCPGNPLPISYAISLGITDILVILTLPMNVPQMDAWLLKFLGVTFLKELSPGLREDIEKFDENYDKELKYITGEKPLPRGVRIAAIYPKIMPVSSYTMDKNILKQGAAAAMEFTEQVFSAAYTE